MNWHAQVLARGAAGMRRASVRAADRDQLDAVRRASRLLLLRLVRIGLRERREGDGGEHLPRARGAAGRAGDQRRPSCIA